MAPEAPPKPKGGLSLYANLLDKGDNAAKPGTISSAPVLYRQPSDGADIKTATAADKQQISAGS